MALARCIAFHGNTTLVRQDPAVTVVHDVLYHPAEWALYDQNRQVIEGSGYVRGPDAQMVGAGRLTVMDPAQVTAEAPDECYFFLGPMHLHYGHFLLASLCRMWTWTRAAFPGMKLLTYGDPPAAFDRAPYIATLLGALGVGLDDLVAFAGPTRIRRVVVASPCFEETNFAHATFARMTRQIGSRLLEGTVAAPNDTPVYLARWQLPRGVHRVVNEEAFVSVLADAGVDVVFPERLSLQQQILLMADRPNIVGQGGSAFHTVAFIDAPRKLLMLQNGATLLSNQPLIDRICGHDGLYLYAPGGMEPLPATEEFGLNFRLTDPRGTAQDLLRILSPFMGARTVTVLQEQSAYGAGDDAAIDGVARTNLALGRPTRQSSVEDFSRGLSPAEDSAGAVCGFCTGGYQFHTALQENPWWDVDFGSIAGIEEVRLFNRLDAGRERARHFQLQVSGDGVAWSVISEADLPGSFGGMDGHPFVWTAPGPCVTRYFRVTMIGLTYLHLDQVVVYGRLVDPGAPPAANGSDHVAVDH